MLHQNDNVLFNQSRNVLMWGYNFLLRKGGNNGREGHYRNADQGTQEAKDHTRGDRETYNTEDSGLNNWGNRKTCTKDHKSSTGRR